MEVKNFEAQYLYSNEVHKNEHIKQFDKSVENFNKLIEESESVLKRKLKLKEKKDLLSIGAETVINTIRAAFRFPNATEQFNLDSEGIDLTDLKAQDEICKLYRSKDQLPVLENGKYVNDKEKIELINARYDIYTTNEKQNKALALGKKLEKIFEEMLQEDIINRHQLQSIVEPLHFLKVELIEERKYSKNPYGIRVNKSYINNMIK